MICFQIIGDNYYLDAILQHRIYQSGYLKYIKKNLLAKITEDAAY